MDGQSQADFLEELVVGDGAGVVAEHSLDYRGLVGVEPGVEGGDHSVNVHWVTGGLVPCDRPQDFGE